MRVCYSYTYNKQEFEDIKKFFEAQGVKVCIVPIADEFRKVGDTRPVKTKYYIQEAPTYDYAGDVLS